MPVAAPADKRFRRAHVSPAKRRAWLPPWRTLVLMTAAVAAGGAIAYTAVHAALTSGALTVGRITVSGNTRISRGEVLALLEGMHGAHMVTIDLESWRQRLLTSPWVADAALRRVLPGTLSVAIAERQPMGIARIGDQLYLIDDRGMVIDEFGPNYAEFDLPIIDGLAASPNLSAGASAKAETDGLLIDDVRAALAGRLLNELQRRPDLARRVSQIDVSDSRDAVVILKGDTVMVRVGADRFVERVQSYLDLEPALRDRIPQIDYVDLRFDERVYVRPQASSLGLRARSKTGGGE
jgi:cell division protein FtsQ